MRSKIALSMLALLFICGCVSTKSYQRHGAEMYAKGVEDIKASFDKAFNACMREGTDLEKKYNSLVKKYMRMKDNCDLMYGK